VLGLRRAHPGDAGHAESPSAPAGRLCPRDSAEMAEFIESNVTVWRCPQCHWTERITQGGIVDVQPGLFVPEE